MASQTQTWMQGQLPRVQWGPVITGVLCAVAAQIVLGLFGIAFGFAAQPGGRALGTLAAIWELVTPIVASFIGAFVAVRVAGDREAAGAYLHGVIVWCIGLIAGALFITGSLASGAMTAGTAASGNAGAMRSMTGIQGRTAGATRAQDRATADDLATGAAAGTGAAAVAALLGLGGALLGAGVARREVTRGDAGRHRGDARRRPIEGEYREYEVSSGVVYGDGDRVTTRAPGGPEVGGRTGEDPRIPH